MDYRVDEKGKIFTEHMTKQRMSVTAGVGNLVIHGFIHVKPEIRLKDELNDGEMFIAITDARVTPSPGDTPMYETAALIVNKTQIIWIFENESK